MPDDEVLAIAKSRLGRVLRGKYRLDRVLGIGGMAVVYAATHRNKKRFAIKMLHPELSIRENIRTRFLREGYVANSVEHPGAVAVLDDDVAEDGSAFIVMELLDGAPVDDVWTRQGKRLPLGTVLAIGDALLDVLVAAHGKKVVHRDLKPANLFLTSDGRLEVLDFGIARLHDETSSEATATGQMLGTPAYMAPEQAMAESTKIDAQTDLWAVGATMFSLLSGEFVHTGENASQLLVGAATKKARPIASVAKDVPKPIADVIDKALAFDKKDRWGSAAEMREALAKACIEATGAPVAALPRTEGTTAPRITGLERTETSGDGRAPPSGGAAFDATVDAKSGDVSPAQSTANGISRSTSREPAGGRWRGAAVAVLACATLVGGLAGYRVLHAPRVRYCLEDDMTQGGPRCLFEVQADVLARRRRSLPRTIERGGRVERIEFINFAGRISDDFAHEEVARDGSGGVKEITKYDGFGVQFEWQKWSDRGHRVEFVDVDGKSPRHMDDYLSEYAYGWSPDGRHNPPTSMLLDYDAQGRQTRVLFLGVTGRPRADSAGKYGVTLEYGKTPGLVTKQTNLGFDGAPAPDSNGTVYERRDDSGLPWTEERYFDADDRPFSRDGVHRLRTDHDDIQRTGYTSFGLHDEPALFVGSTEYLPSGSLNGFQDVSWRAVWDPVMRTVDSSGRDEHGKLRGWVQRETFDERGRLARLDYLDGQGNKIVTTNREGQGSNVDGVSTNTGASTERFAYDDQNHRVLIEVLDPAGAPMAGVEGFARREAKYDGANNAVEVRFEDEAGRPAPSREGAAIERATFDERGLELARSSFDADDHPVGTVHGYALRRSKYDRLRNLVEVAYFGVDGKPAVSDQGFATQRWTYDDNDDLVGVTFLDATGTPTIVSASDFGSGFATVRFQNDERGLFVQIDYLDAHGDPIVTTDGYASSRLTRDRHGDVTESRFLGRHGEPILREGGFARRTCTFDSTRRPVERALFDAAGQPVRGTEGWAIERERYDERGLVVRTDHLDVTGAPALDREGEASISYEYDLRGNVVSWTSLDVAGKPILRHDGFATKKTTYDERGDVIQEVLVGADGQPVVGQAGWSAQRQRYDDFHDLVEEAFFDAAREPVVPKDLTYASKRQRFDARHRLTEVTYFDARGAPTKGPDGAATVRYERDGRGRAVTTSYFDGMGAATASNDGHIVVRSAYDAANRVTDEHFVDAAGTPRAAADGCGGHTTTYDLLGRKVEERCLGPDDKPTLGTSRWAIRRTLHDAHGNDVEIATYGADGELAADAEGVARRRNRYDERSLLLETTYFDADDKPAHDRRGVHSVRFTYDDARKKVGESSFDLAGRPVSAAKSR